MAVEIVGSGLTFALSDTDGQPAPQNVAIPDGAEIALLFWHRFSFTPGAQLTGATIGGEAFTILVNTVGTGSAGNYGCAWADVTELSGPLFTRNAPRRYLSRRTRLAREPVLYRSMHA